MTSAKQQIADDKRTPKIAHMRNGAKNHPHDKAKNRPQDELKNHPDIIKPVCLKGVSRRVVCPGVVCLRGVIDEVPLKALLMSMGFQLGALVFVSGVYWC